MGKTFAPRKVVVLLTGRHAGSKAMVVKVFHQGQRYGCAWVAGIGRCSRKGMKSTGTGKTAIRSKMKLFLKCVNLNHLLPTRYSFDIDLDKNSDDKDVYRDPGLKRKVRLGLR